MTAPIIENNYTGDGSTVLFSFTFEYIEATDIEVSIDAVTVATTAYSLANSTTIEFVTAPAVGAAIRIYRNTTVNDPKATFFPGSAIRAQDLNDNFEQILFVTQEADAISERAEAAADAAQIATTAAQAASASATAAANQAQSQVNAAQVAAAAAAADANTATTNAATAVTTANAATATANQAATDAAAAATNASSAATSATAAQASATAAQTAATSANTAAAAAQLQATVATTNATAAQTAAANAQGAAATAATDAATAVATANSATTTANTASTDASTALTAANNAVSTANATNATANQASTDAASAVTTANSAVTTANSAATDAATAVSTANSASTTASSAATAAATAQTTANSAVTTANAAQTTANTASSLATTTAAAVANAYLFNNVAAVANIPSSPSNGDAVRVVNSTNIESTSSVQGVPSGFVGDSGINVEIIYSSSAGKWNYIAYNANDPDDRYGYPPYVDVTRQNTVDAAALSGRPLNSTHLGTFTGSIISDNTTVKTALQELETEVETKADLVGGTVPTSQLPALAITTFLGTVANQTAMLALSGQRGDFAIRSDTSTTFVLVSDGGSNLSDWQELETPTVPIQSVNSQTGTVVLGPSDVGAISAVSGGTFGGNVEIGGGIDLNTNGSASFTGDLTVGSSVVRADGSAFFDSTVTRGNFDTSQNSGSGVRLADGLLQVQRNTSSANTVSLLQGYYGSTKKVDIKAGGSAEFAGNVSFGNEVGASTSVDGCTIYSLGNIYASRSGTNNLWVGRQTGTAGNTSNIKADGSATFAGGAIELKSSGQVYSNRTVGSGACFYGNLNGTNTSSILADGSATFGGNITVGSPDTNASSGQGSSVQSNGVIRAQRSNSTANTLSMFSGYKGTSETFRVNVDGSASFAGDVEVGDIANGNALKFYSTGWLDIRGDATAGTGGLSIYDGAVQTSNRTVYLTPGGDATFAGDVTASGNVTAFSDARLKKDIELIPNALDKVLSLRGVTFTDIASDERRTGVIAQEVQAVLPEAVKEGEEYLSVAYGNLVGVLVESIKELEARVRELEGK